MRVSSGKNNKDNIHKETQPDKRKISTWKLCLLASLVVALIVNVIYIIRGIAPYGDNSILTIDCFHQYAPFLLEMRHRILEGKSLIYSWEAGLGKDLYVQTAYYTASPLDYLVLLIKPEQICGFVAFLICLKLSLCAASFTYYISRKNISNGIFTILFGVMYAFCGFNACFYWNFMWLDTTALFPLLILAFENMLENHSSRNNVIYCLLLSAEMIVNFYLAFLVCIFLVLYFLKVILEKQRTRKEIGTALLDFLCFSVLAAVIAAFLLLPAAIAISRTRSDKSMKPTFTFYLSFFQLIAAHFTGARPSVMSRNQDAPNIYSGVITLLLIPLYLKYCPDSDRKKRCNLIFEAFLLFCCIFEPFDYIAHGFYFPANMPHRYSFIYSFVLLTMAYRAIPYITSSGVKAYLKTAVVLSVLLIVTDRLISPNLADYEAVLSNVELIGNVCLLFGYAILIWRLSVTSHKMLIQGMTACVICAECGYMYFNSIEVTTSRSKFTEHMQDTSDAMKMIQKEEGGRVVRSDYARVDEINEGSVYHFNGFSTFSSMVPSDLTDMMQSLGVVSSAKTFRFYDEPPLINTMFDMRYLYSADNKGISEHMDSLKDYRTISLWKNRANVSLGYVVNNNIKDWDLHQETPFKVQNDFISTAAGIDDPMYTSVPATKVNLDHGQFLATDGTGGFTYKLDDPYKLKNVPVVTAVYKCPIDSDLYLYVNSENSDGVNYQTSKERQKRDLGAGNATIHIGKVSAGEEIVVQFALNKKGEFDTHYPEAGSVQINMAAYHDAAFQQAQSALSSSPWNPDRFEDTYVSGECNAKKDSVLYTSIPYSDGWNVKVDGKNAEKIKIGDGGLIGVDLSAGKHRVSFTYHTPGLKEGGCISLAGLFVLFGYGIIGNRRKKKDEQEKQNQ